VLLDPRLPEQPGVREREVRAQVQQEQPVPELPRVQRGDLRSGKSARFYTFKVLSLVYDISTCSQFL
jgi:hypothetical protein